MKIIEKLKLSTLHSGSILLYEEGLFYRMYGESAYLFVKYIKPFKVTESTLKAMSHPFYMAGFPVKSLSSLFANYTIVTCPEGYLRIDSTSFVFVDEEYKQWEFNSHHIACAGKEKHLDMSMNTRINPLDSDLMSVIKDLYSFRINAVTPLDCANFLSELQKRLNGNSPYHIVSTESADMFSNLP